MWTAVSDVCTVESILCLKVFYATLVSWLSLAVTTFLTEPCSQLLYADGEREYGTDVSEQLSLVGAPDTNATSPAELHHGAGMYCL